MRNFPPPPGSERTDSQWCELVVGIARVRPATSKEVVESFWSSVVPELDQDRAVEITGPEDEAWFHLRRTKKPNSDPHSTQYAFARIEILRLKASVFQADVLERLRVLPEALPGVLCADWWPVCFLPRHDNAFLSFLQKLSVLRAVRGLLCSEYLAQITAPFDMCPQCQRAHEVMTDPNASWFQELSPWFEHMSSTHMNAYRTHEYAHWFGHILSGWHG